MRVLALTVALAVAGCGSSGGDAETPVPESVTGLITQVVFDGDEVTGFVIEARAGTYELLIDPEYDYGFNLRHLEVHRRDELPVQVEVVQHDGELYAHEVIDV